jgi:glycosyltransferase involved in cell wall biosynthesis
MMEDKKPRTKVSVLMLTYNQEKYIDEAIRGVMSQQTNFSFRLVIGDDHSTDKTLQKCKQWHGRYPAHITILENEQNRGLQQNFIRTYNACTGDYLAICEGDDYWFDTSKLQRQVNFLDCHPDFSTCFHRVVNYFEADDSKSLSNGGQQQITSLIDLARSNYVSNVSAVWRRGLFGPLPQWFADVSTYDYAIHMLNAQFGKLYYMRRPMAVYRQHSNAIWSQSGPEKRYQIASQIRALLMDYFQEKDLSVYESLLASYNANSLALLRLYISQNEEEKAEAVRVDILQHNAWTREELTAKEAAPKMSRKDEVKKTTFSFLKESRKVVSRFLPLPHAKESLT